MTTTIVKSVCWNTNILFVKGHFIIQASLFLTYLLTYLINNIHIFTIRGLHYSCNRYVMSKVWIIGSKHKKSTDSTIHPHTFFPHIALSALILKINIDPDEVFYPGNHVAASSFVLTNLSTFLFKNFRNCCIFCYTRWFYLNLKSGDQHWHL